MTPAVHDALEALLALRAEHNVLTAHQERQRLAQSDNEGEE
jgi:hypothetical protein